MKNIKLSFKGYWREEKRQYIPHFTGIYLVYSCKYCQSEDAVSLSDLIYIGQSEDVNSRISDHCQKNDFTPTLKEGETLCFSVAAVNHELLDLVENALVCAQKPTCNKRLTDSYRYENAGFDIDGRCALLKYTSFTISNP